MGGRHDRLPHRTLVQLAVEELLINKIPPRAEQEINLELKVKYSEESGKVELELLYAGVEYNPFTDDDEEDELSLRILSNMTSNVGFEYRNELNFLKMEV